MSPVAPVFDHADLHGLVDGHIDGARRTATLRRLATSPADRARVEAWQGQNDLLRSSFAGIEREPLPAILDLTAKSRLQCIPANDAPLVAPAAPADAVPGRGGRIVAAIATIIVIAAGLASSWLLQDTSRHEQTAADATRDRTIEAIAPATEVGNRIDKLPTTEIPDLHFNGFGFTGAETTANPLSIVFHYEAGSDRIRVRVSRAALPTNGPTSIKATGDGYSWQSHHKSFVVSGTVGPERLRDIAAALKKDSSDR